MSVGGEVLGRYAQRTVRYRSRSGFLRYAGIMATFVLCFGIWLTWSSADAWANGTWAASTRFSTYFGLVFGLLFVMMTGPWLVLILRPRVTLRSGILRIPRGVFHTTRIAAQDVSGIGLAYKLVNNAFNVRVAAGWYLTVWHGAAAAEQTGISYVPMLWRYRGPAAAEKFLATPATAAGDASRDFSLDRFDPAAQTDGAKLASTHAGRVARDLYRRLQLLQGPDGLLEATEQQKHARASGRWELSTILAVWSPDGVMSRPGL